MGLLIGINNTGNWSDTDDYIRMTRYVALGTGTIEELQVYTGNTGSFKAGIYSDNEGDPDSLLGVNNTGVSGTTSDWTTIALSSSVNVISGTYYWLAVIADIDNTTKSELGSGTTIYKSQSYSSGLPSPAGTGYGTTSAREIPIRALGGPDGNSLFFGGGF